MRITGFRRFWYYLSIAILTSLGWLSSSSVNFAGSSDVALAASDPVIAAAGDIACDPASSSFNSGNGTSGSCRQKYTSDLLVNAGLAAVLPLGDIQYYCGGYQAWLKSYDLSWGRVKSITRPVVGNHEYLTSGGTDCTSANAGAAGYFKYFGSAAGNPSQGYYSYNIGAWHLIALNSNCSSAGGCSSTSPQGKWLTADLAANSNLCTLAYWHIPLFSSGGRANSNTKSLWQILYNNNVDVILNGHDHIYERFAPQTPDGKLDTARGIRQFIVGSGGSNHTSLATIAANSEVRNTDTFGVLKLTLHPTSYDWKFVPEAGKAFTDSGTGLCHGSGTSSTPASTATRTRTATPGSSPTRTSTLLPVSSPSSANTYTFIPVADTYVNQSSPTTNYGSSSLLRTDGSPLVRSFMRFNLQNLTGQVTRVTLRVYANSQSNAGYEVRSVTSNTWGETTTNYNNAPAIGSVVGTSGPVSSGQWSSVNLTPLITGNGTYNIALTTANSTALSLASREAASANRPQLVVEVQSASMAALVAAPLPTDTATVLNTPSPTVTMSQTPTGTPTVAPTDTQTSINTVTDIPSATATATPTQNVTDTATMPPDLGSFTPTLEEAPTDTLTPTDTETPVSTPTDPAVSEATTFTFTPDADAYVNQSGVNTNYGASTQLRVDGSPLVQSFMRFDVQNLTGQITRVTLRVYANSQSSLGYEVWSVTNSWSELDINYNNAPPLESAISASGPFSAGTWISVDLTSLVTGNGTYDFALTTGSSTAFSLASREAESNAPQLIIETTP